MPVYAGPWWKDGEAGHGFVRIERGRVVDKGERSPAGATPAVILEGLHNYHTHVGDAFLRGRVLPRGLDALVKPVTGYKHRMLATAKPSVLQSGVRRALQGYAASGTRTILDFREQGIQGLAWVRRVQDALGQDAPRVHLLARPTGPNPSETDMAEVVERADGIGLPSLSDVGAATLRVAAEACQHAKKPLAMHASERRREAIEAILEARPDLLVHMNAATPADLRRVRDAGVPVAACPSSNAYFRIPSQVRSLRRAGVRFYLGTDNAMLGNADLVREAREAKKRCPEVRDDELLLALNTPPEKAIKRVRRVTLPPGGGEAIVVLALRGKRVRWAAKPILARR